MAKETDTMTLRLSCDLLKVIRKQAKEKGISITAAVEGLLRLALDLPYPTPENPFKESRR